MLNKRPEGLRTWVEVDKKAIENNYHVFRSLISKDTKIMAVVKSNAYGHGLAEFSKEAETLGVDWLGVDSMVEARTLRKNGIKIPILVLGYTLPELVNEATENDISLTISCFDQLNELEKIKTKKDKKIHIKVDTGMCRQGFLETDMEKLISILSIKSPNKNLFIEGLFTHFSSAKNPAFPQFTKNQISLFDKWKKTFFEAGLKPIIHASATAGAILYGESHFDMIRLGIGFYGLWPSKETENFAKDKMKLMPALSWKTLVSEIKEIKEGSRIGYDGVELTRKKTKIAICPIGYWHGFPRAFSSVGQVIVGGKIVRVLGRISMDMIIIDVTDIPKISIKDEVVLIGSQGKCKISADEISSIIEMSPYELITRINPLIKRFYV